jgi:catechol 2,3-dioxygenase-like lactoylglutathione lyase family enzyme
LVRLGQRIPALPVRSTEAAVGFYRDSFGLDVVHQDGGSRDGAKDTDFGTRELATLDHDGNLVEYFQWRDE